MSPDDFDANLTAGGIQHDTICWFVKGGIGTQFGNNFNALKEINDA